MRLQKIPFVNSYGPQAAAPLYEPELENAARVDNSIKLETTGKAFFNQYYHILDVKKWLEFGKISDFGVEIQGTGSVEVTFFSIKKPRTPIHSAITDLKTNRLLHLPDTLFFYDQVYFSVSAITSANITSLLWVAQPEGVANVIKPVIVICTYQREEYLHRNLRILKNNIPEGWGLYVVDNGRTIDESSFEQDYPDFRLFPNPNTGGSGGFTRGLLEAVNDSADWSHVLFMDDDVVIEPEALFRTDALLSLLKDEYREAFVGGAMFRLEKPTIQQESSARWNGWRIKQNHHLLDMSRRRDLARGFSEAKHKNEYAGWWYCAIPLLPGIEKDLPLQVFLRGDDIEYSLRRASYIITLSGIATWHESFENKENPVVSHYLIIRNSLIVNLSKSVPLHRSLLFVVSRYVNQLRMGNLRNLKLIRYAINEVIFQPASALSGVNPFGKIMSPRPGTNIPGFPMLLIHLAGRYKTLRATYNAHQ